MKTRIQTQAEADIANGKFNYFHDGFFKRLQITSEDELLADLPWASKRQFAMNEEELLATGLRGWPDKAIELEIHHFNYDWPNQPSNRAILLRASGVTELLNDLLRFVGREIFVLRFQTNAVATSCVLTYHEQDAGPVRSMENGVTKVLFSAKAIEIEEITWAEPPAAPYSEPAPRSPQG